MREKKTIKESRIIISSSISNNSEKNLINEYLINNRKKYEKIENNKSETTTATKNIVESNFSMGNKVLCSKSFTFILSQ